jgi:phospholipase C
MKQLMVILVVLLLALSLSAQTFDHVIIIVQENRTPDNLFGASGLPGADLQIHPKGTAVALNTTGDFDHSHVGFLAEASGTYPHGSGVYVASGVDPYWQLAAEYGFANYMFQTNQGASFPARQMLISGTSAPSDTSDLFVSDNSITGTVGCKAKAGSLVPTIAPDGVMGAVFPCFERSSLIDLLVNAGLTWRYYAAAFPPRSGLLPTR